MEDAFDFGDGVGVEECLVSVANDQFGFCAVEVTARVDAAVTRSRWAGVYLADNVVKGNCGWNLCQGHERRAVGGERADRMSLLCNA
jgi:hypothetical protein